MPQPQRDDAPPLVLLVEDNPGDVDLVTERVEQDHSRPLTIDVAKCLGEAIPLLRARPYDAVLLDLGLPDSDGVETLERVREAAPAVPIIVVTGHDDVSLGQRCFDLGAQDYLIKGSIEGFVPHAVYNAVARTRAARRLSESMVQRTRAEDAQQRAEESLRDSRHMLQLITDNMFDVVAVSDMEVRTTYASPSHRQFGYDPESLIGRPTHEMIHQEDLSTVMTALAAGVADGLPRTAEYRLRRADGTYAWVETAGKLLHDQDGAPCGMLFSTRDVSARRGALELLRASERRAQQYLDVAAVMLLGMDDEGRINMINRRGREVFGAQSPDDVLGRRWSDFVPDRNREQTRTRLGTVLSGKGGVDECFEDDLLTLGGDVRRIAWRVAVVRNTKDEIIGALASGEDQTELLQMRAQLAQADRLASIGTLAAGVAHEINNPLAYVLHNLESLSKSVAELIEGHSGGGGQHDSKRDDLLAEIRMCFADALDGAVRIREISRELGTFSRVDADEITDVDVTEVLQTALSMAFHEIKYRACLVKDFSTVPTVLATQGRLAQVFLNLIINATHAIEEGDVEHNEIRVRTWTEDDTACVEIRDTGCGIPAENLSQVFVPFFTTKPVGTGSGLGLSISRNIVERHGGSIAVESAPGLGTAFTVRLPTGHANRGAGKIVERPASEEVSGRILIIDDERRIRTAMARMLSAHEIVQADSGRSARRIVETDRRFDLIVCDMMMPEVSGMEFHQWLQSFDPVLAERVIFVTGGAFTPRTREYLSKVGNPWLAKPFDVSEFKHLVADGVRSVRMSR